MDGALLIFLLVYIAMAVGTLPGFKVDRTGAALVGALALLATGEMTSEQAWAAIDYRTIGMLFGLMLVSGAFVVSGFYATVAARVAQLDVSPPVLLAVLVAVGGALSAVLTNDVVVVAMTPLLIAATMARGLNPVPFLLGFCFATNIGSVATVIGSPQNMVIAQSLGLGFIDFMAKTTVPGLLSLPVAWAIVAVLYRGRWALPPGQRPAAPAAGATPPFLMLETVKASIVTLTVVAAFVATDWPRDQIALAAGAVLLVNRRIASGDVLRQVDGDLLILIMGLFVVNAAMAATGLPQHILGEARALGINLQEPMPLFWVGAVFSDIVGNNPAVMLLMPFVSAAPDATALGAALALGTGFSSNLFVFGSLAGIIVVEQAAAHGVRISFRDFARAGVPVSLATMLVGQIWVLLVLA
jgi:Na+/H+ antiporter NhaD/arsenite permease-like protein